MKDQHILTDDEVARRQKQGEGHAFDVVRYDQHVTEWRVFACKKNADDIRAKLGIV